MSDQTTPLPQASDESKPRAGVILSNALGGPLRAARHGLWGAFGLLAAAELTGLVAVLSSLFDEPAVGPIFSGLLLIVAARGIFGAAMAFGFLTSRPVQGSAYGRVSIAAVILLVCYALTLYRFLAVDPLGGLERFPAPKGLDAATAQIFDNVVNWMKTNWSGFFDVLTKMLRSTLGFIDTLFVGTPWPVVALVALLMAFHLSGRRATIFTAVALAYLGLFGFWEKSMSTLAIVATSVLICVVIGLPMGILCAKSQRVRSAFEPVMDVMQTLPTFVYLIPAVAFFSVGQAPGVIATVIFALPPVVRLTALGIKQVPENVIEAANAFGATGAQLLFKVELPLAIPSIRLGVNQTIMMCLSMVVVAAMIGSGGLGLDVIRSLQMLQTGRGLLAGLAIVFCAMMLDRMLRGRERKSSRQG